MGRTRFGRFAIWAASLVVLAPAHAQTSLEYAVKAAYLAKFVPFIEWPDGVFASAQAPVSICILGTDPFGDAIDRTAASGSGAGRPLAIRRIATDGPVDGCQLLYVREADAAMLDALSGKPVVTVSDSGKPAHGVISFVMVDNHVRFDIDDAAAAKDGLRISSKLLDLAHSVIRRRGP